MDDVIFIEEIGRYGRVSQRHRLDLPVGASVQIGRAFDCDVILDDPHVAASHVLVSREEDGSLSVVDQGSVNRLRIPHQRATVDSLHISPGSGFGEFLLGRTRLKIYPGAPELAGELPLAGQRGLWPVALVAAVAALGLMLMFEWLKASSEFRWTAQLGESTFLVLLLLFWTGLWAGACRLFRGQALFAMHLLIAASALAASLLLHWLLPLLAYSLSLSWLTAMEFAIVWLTIGAAAILHLRVIGPSHGRLQAAIVVLLVALGMSPEIVRTVWPEPGFERSHYVRVLQPPVVRIAGAQPVDQFLADLDTLRPRLEAARDELDRVVPEAPDADDLVDPPD